MWRGALGLLVLRGGSPAVRSPGPLVGKVQPELPEDKDGEVQNLAVRCLGPLISEVLLKLLEDKDSEAQNVAVRCLGPLVLPSVFAL